MTSYNRLKKYLLLLVLVLFSFLIGCVAQHTTAVVPQQNEEILKIGVSANAPPLIYKEKGELKGLEIELGNRLAAFLGKKPQFIEYPWDRQLSHLENGEVDIVMSGMTVTPKRSYRVAFSKPYLRSGQILLVRTTQARKFSSGIYDVMGQRPLIGVIEGTTGDFFITKTINNPRLTRFKTSEEAVKSLLKEKIDVVVHDAPILCHYAAMNEGTLAPILQMATTEYYAWAINKKSGELVTNVNKFIDTESKNNKLSQTVSNWIPYLNR